MVGKATCTPPFVIMILEFKREFVTLKQIAVLMILRKQMEMILNLFVIYLLVPSRRVARSGGL